MTVKDRRARQKTLLRQQIIDAARELLVRDGYEKLSMRKVAERIDYSPTAIYLHFKDKRELVSSLCDETFSRLARELESLPEEFRDPVVRLRKGLERYIAFGLAHPDHYLAAFVLPMPGHMGPARKAESMRRLRRGTRRTSSGSRSCFMSFDTAGLSRKQVTKALTKRECARTSTACHPRSSLGST